MVDIPDTLGNGLPPAPPKVSQRVLAQYIRDMSFENIQAQKGLSSNLLSEVSIQVTLEGKNRGESNHYEVITKLNITSKAKESGEVLYLLMIEYAALFQIDGVPVAQMHPYLMIECPRVSFPFLRRIVNDITRDGGVLPLSLEMIDFESIFRREQARLQSARRTPASASGLDS